MQGKQSVMQNEITEPPGRDVCNSRAIAKLYPFYTLWGIVLSCVIDFAEALITYAYASVTLRDEVAARTALEEALSLSRERENQDDSARALCGLGHLALRQGDLAQARANYEESITLVQGRWLIPRLKWVLASSLEGISRR